MKRTGLSRFLVMKLVHEIDSPWFVMGERAWMVDESAFDAQMERKKVHGYRKCGHGAKT